MRAIHLSVCVAPVRGALGHGDHGNCRPTIKVLYYNYYYCYYYYGKRRKVGVTARFINKRRTKVKRGLEPVWKNLERKRDVLSLALSQW